MLIIQCSKVSSSHKNYKRTVKNGFLCKMWRVGFFLSAVLQISTAQFLDGFGKIFFYSVIKWVLNGFLGLGPSVMKSGQMNSRSVPVKRSFYNLMDDRFKNDDFMDSFMPSKRFDIDSPFDSF